MTPETTTESEQIHREYVLDVRIVEVTADGNDAADGEATAGGEPRYRFEAPRHVGVAFDDPEMAELYADVYFDANGFQEAETGERGLPPEVVQAGRDTLVAYFLARQPVDRYWLASYYGEKPEKIDRYVSRVRKRAGEIRDGVAERDLG